MVSAGKSPSDCIEVTGCQIATGNLYEDADPLVMPTSAAAARGAYAMSGTTPDQMDIAEVGSSSRTREVRNILILPMLRAPGSRLLHGD